VSSVDKNALDGCAAPLVLRAATTNNGVALSYRAMHSVQNQPKVTRVARPVASFKQGGVEVSVWRNHTDKGDMFNTTIRNSYEDDATGELGGILMQQGSGADHRKEV